MEQEKKLSEQESLALITQMISRAKEAYYSTGLDAIMWGCVIAICSLVRLSEIHFGYKLPFDIYLLTVVAVIPQIFIVIKEKKERKAKTYDDAFIGYLWLSFGISIFLLILICNNVFNEWGAWTDKYQAATGQSTSPGFYEFVAPLFLMLYGMPTFVTGAACKFKPMLWGGIFCWLCSIATIYTSIKLDLILTASAAIIAWLIPGILIKIEYGRVKKEQAQLNV
jgi:uncharacterized protein with PQ loop repeat